MIALRCKIMELLIDIEGTISKRQGELLNKALSFYIPKADSIQIQDSDTFLDDKQIREGVIELSVCINEDILFYITHKGDIDGCTRLKDDPMMSHTTQPPAPASAPTRAPLTIKDVTLINSNHAHTMRTDLYIELIKQEQNALDTLKELNVSSSVLKGKQLKHLENIEQLVSLMDTHCT